METETQNFKYKYLPIGSVVLLANAKKRVMIIGYKPVTTNENENGVNETTEWDYSGCIYPEGLLSTEQVLLFNKSQIAQIYFVGFEDDESKMFHNALNSI